MDKVREYLKEAEIEFGDTNYNEQYNLCHASLNSLGIRSGLDPNVKDVLRKHGLGKMTPEGKKEFIALLDGCINLLKVNK